MPFYLPKPESYGRVHPEFGTLTAEMKPVFTNWSGPQIDWIEVTAPADVVAAVEAAPFHAESDSVSDTHPKFKHKNKPAVVADEEK